MTAIAITGFDSPVSNAIRKMVLIAMAKEATDYAELLGRCGPNPIEDTPEYYVEMDRKIADAYADADRLLKEAGVS